MPRRRHDTSSEDSDSSDAGSASRRSARSKDKIRQRKANRSESVSSVDERRSKSSKNRRRGSDSDVSPVKKPVSAKVEKSKAKESKKKSDKGSKRQLSGSDSSPDKKKSRGADKNDKSRTQKNVRVQRSNSPQENRGQRANNKGDRRGGPRYLDRDLDSKGPIRGRRSPERNSGRGNRFEEQTVGQFLESPPRRGRERDDRDTRDFDDRPNRGGNRNEPLSRSFDRSSDRRNFAGRDIQRSRSPQGRQTRNRNDSWRSEEQNFDQRFGRSRSPNVRKRNRSSSTDGRNSSFQSPTGRRSFSDRHRSTSIDAVDQQSSQKKGNKKNKKKSSANVVASDSDIQSPIKETDVSKKSKKSKSKRDDSIEKSFERSKLSLSEENLHAAAFDDLDASKKDKTKKLKKSKSKRRKSLSDSESISPDRNKKLDKEAKKSSKKTGKLLKKSKRSKAPTEEIDTQSDSADKSKVDGGKKNKSQKHGPLSRSPSPLDDSLNRSGASEFNRSRSSETAVGRNHDMAKFESEPESGEITDSEDEGEKINRQALKSQIKKPTEEELQNIEDEKYMEEKRKSNSSGSGGTGGRVDSGRDRGRERDRDRGSKRKQEATKEPEPVEPSPSPAPKKPRPADGGVAALTGRTGGAYIPPARLRAMQANITDKSSVEYQRISWEALKKSINGLVNKVNVSNIEMIVRELFQENIVRGRGLMARSIIQAQAASPTFTHVYAALVAIVNTKFPQNGELVLKRLIQQFRRGFKRNDKSICMSSTRFIAHLVNQQVAHEVLSLEVLTLLLEEPTNDSVEVSIGFLKECGHKLTDVSPRGINAIFERLRNILHEGQIDTRVQYMVEVMFAVRKDGFKDNPSVLEELDLVEEDDQFTHLLNLEDVTNGEELLNVFRPDPNFLESEEKYSVLKKEILGEGSSDEEDGSGSGSGSDSSDEESGEEAGEEAKQTIIDTTETNMVALRRTIYLTIQSSLDFEECAHKLMKMELKPGQEVELCNMILDCCAQMRTYEKFFGLLAGRFCMLDKKYVEPFQQMFQEQYGTIHRLETNKLRNVAKFFAHLLHTDAISWAVLCAIKLNEEDTTSASRIFIKILFQELSEYLGLPKLNDRLKDPTLIDYFGGLMPRDNPRDTRFAINFFTTIGLGGLTDDLRDHLKSVSKKLMEQKQQQEEQAGKSSSDSSGASSSDSSDSLSESDSSNSDSSDSDSSVDEIRKRKKKEKPKEREKKKEKEKEKGKGKSRNEPDLPREKNRKNRQEKDKSNGAIEKKDRKKGKKDKKVKNGGNASKLDDQFRRLAKLANYGTDVLDTREKEISLPRQEDKGRGDREKGDRGNRDRGDRDRGERGDRGDREKGDRRGKRAGRSLDGDIFEMERGRREMERDFYDGRERMIDPRDRMDYDRPPMLDRSFDSSFEGRDDREPRRGRKGRDYIDDDTPIQIERNFARLDVYEDKFAREREMNLEYLRGRQEFEDYFRGRSDLPRDAYDREDFRGPRGRPVEWDDRRFAAGPYGDREFDRGMDEGRRRGRNRSEERPPIVRDERRRRR